MSLQEILDGLSVFLNGIFLGIENLLQIFFGTPPIGGMPLGMWLLGFGVVVSVVYAMFGGD